MSKRKVLAGLLLLGLLLFSSMAYALEINTEKAPVFKEAEPMPETLPAPGELLVRLELPESIQVGVPFWVDVYLYFSKENVAGLTRIALISSSTSIKFTGKIEGGNQIGWTMGQDATSLANGVIQVDQSDSEVKFSHVSRNYVLFGRLEAVASKPVSTFGFALKPGFSEAYYLNPDPDDANYVDIKRDDIDNVRCGNEALLSKYGYGADKICEIVFKTITNTNSFSNSYKKYLEPVFKPYTLKMGNTRIIRNSLCIPNPDACSGKCGNVDNGCGKIVSCGSSCGSGKVCISNVCQAAPSQLSSEDKELCDAVIKVPAAEDKVLLSKQAETLSGWGNPCKTDGDCKAEYSCSDNKCVASKYSLLSSIFTALTDWLGVKFS